MTFPVQICPEWHAVLPHLDHLPKAASKDQEIAAHTHTMTMKELSRWDHMCWCLCVIYCLFEPLSLKAPFFEVFEATYPSYNIGIGTLQYM